MKEGLFISLEGSDGAGKSTQITHIKAFFEEKGIEPIMTREPGGTSIGEKIREILLDKDNAKMDPVTEMMLYASARAQIVRELIRPALAEGKVVICDRYVDSSIAYQAHGRELGDMVAAVNAYAVDGLMPDLTIFLDLDPAVGRARIQGTNRGELDRLEREKLDFHYRVYEGFKSIAEKEGDRFVSIDAARGIEEIRDDIYDRLEKLCKEKGL